MNYGIDYDGTYSADPRIISALIRWILEARGRAYIVTGRKNSQGLPEVEDPREAVSPGDETVFTTAFGDRIPLVLCGNRRKKDVCESIGVHIDIWIDDNPGMIERCKLLEDVPASEL